VRLYLSTGTQHGGQAGLTPSYGSGVHRSNPHNPTPLLRALLVALEQWVSAGIEPPVSRVPTLASNTLTPLESLKFPAIPGVQVPRLMNRIVTRKDWVHPQADAIYNALIPQVDTDGNELAGVRLPDIAVPRATYTGWNLYKSPYPEGELCDRQGSYLPLASPAAERQAQCDPRPALAERYGSQEVYVQRVCEVVRELLAARLLLPEDATRFIDAAARCDVLQTTA
jgi:hypothetical protein